ncbi:CarD family transcriptional regulator [Clostridium saccharobutylicum]|uniref:Putative transcription factor YdeB n=1 Tax=Clostridium saccharobutylicum DSM 13864 TaxID=1345695 RepID=U5MQ58_CLOSA|nr:CarD family transcriptional regulator [Clostridium saccharobutylicum]AGX42725.1 putative transcription factor YdeB [Clostridium saccharobutylicum DSM 13864]AQR90020.1 RNA polymerase-binding transcription factor CarD [Clostridium saccharobutylicum]AQR99925.1 RNA polymerase-binding transcription factor CarD [Clostridium saccharobutylicum]AQS13909.1 RNA polymerase-binding transcription factor CarD [Clostridium saccharobutylicum]MBA2904684.1 RNA polymerase-interacting CarD/CdnL/TRCF family regu
MFKIGDKIVYPNQGIGIIDFIEEKEFKGEKQSYYKMHLLNNTMKVSIPCSMVETSHMRLISDSKTLDNTLKHINKFIHEVETLARINYKERNAIYLGKIKQGTLDNYLEVICNLTQLKKNHSLNSTEKHILRNAKKLVIEEISQAKNLSNDEASNLLDVSIGF